jgi:riboflavin kinase/FMN adenylyltransferase
MRTWTRLEQPEKEFQGGVLTIGNFDGLHFGHQALLKQARDLGHPVVLMTFDPHPLQVLRPEKTFTRIFPRSDLSERLPLYGVDLLLILPFTKEIAGLQAEEFLRKYAGETFKPKHIVAGYDFAFGKNREGNLDFLRDWCARNGCELHVVEARKEEGEIYSSRLIRELITKGEVGKAAEKLGRYFYLRGEVGSGAGRGRTIGIPTMNFKPVKETVPAQGVYAVRVWLEGKMYPGVTNIGVNPTFGGNEGLKIETHVIGHTVEARGRTAVIEFVKRLRPEMKFSSIEDLKNQIKNDILKANEALDDAQPGK